MDILIILQAGVATGTALLFATLGELLAERSGIMNLGVEGMMLLGAMAGYWVSAHYRSVVGSGGWNAGSRIDQSGPRFHHHQFTGGSGGKRSIAQFPGSRSKCSIRRRVKQYSKVYQFFLPVTIPLLSQIPWIGKVFFTNQGVLVYVGYVAFPLVWYFINRTPTRPASASGW